jgi:hypothetical protein
MFKNIRKISNHKYMYFEKKRNSKFSSSNDLLKNVEKYFILKKEDFKKSKI